MMKEELQAVIDRSALAAEAAVAAAAAAAA